MRRPAPTPPGTAGKGRAGSIVRVPQWRAMEHPQIRLWRQEADLETLQRTLHDLVPPDRKSLMLRARGYRDTLFRDLYPGAAPAAGARVLEVGPGVAWIMQAMLEGFPKIGDITGLDVSPTVAREARKRWAPPRVLNTVYDGLHFPFADDTFDTIYSCAAIQHIEKHWAFFTLSEIYRALRPGGHAVLHLMSVHGIPNSATPFNEEALRHVEMRGDSWWMHYYAYDELVVLLSDVIGVTDLDIKPMHSVDTFCVHFSKGTQNRFLRPEVETLTYPARLASPLDGSRDLRDLEEKVSAQAAELALIKGSRAWRVVSTLRGARSRVSSAVSRRRRQP